MSRRRWAYTRGGVPCAPYEVGEEWTPPARVHIQGDAAYDGLRALDGTDISSRKKHRDYMKANDLAPSADFTETWKKAAAEREKIQRGDFDRPQRKEDVRRAIHKTRKP